MQYEIRGFDESGRKTRTWHTDTLEDVFKHSGDMVGSGAVSVEVYRDGLMIMSMGVHVSPWSLESELVGVSG